MILNERQYGITKAQIKKFENSIAELTANAPPANDLNLQLRHQAYLDALNTPFPPEDRRSHQDSIITRDLVLSCSRHRGLRE